MDTLDLEIEMQEYLAKLNSCISKFMELNHNIINSNLPKRETLIKVSNIMTKLSDTQSILKANVDKIEAGIELYKRLYKDNFNEDKTNVMAIGSKALTTGLYTHVIEVDTLDKVPNTNLYYVKSLSQFAVKINETIIRGNIGEIFQDGGGVQIKECLNKNCSSPVCKNWHDPAKHDFKFKSIYFEDKSNYARGQIRNFSSKSWVYTNKKYIKNMRHLGSRSSFSMDLNYIDNIEKNMIIGQSMHDILMCIAMSKISKK